MPTPRNSPQAPAGPRNLPRPLYLQRLLTYVDKPVIKVIVGQRRAGKSMLMRQLVAHVRARSPRSKIAFVDKERHEFSTLRDADDLVRYVTGQVPRGHAYLFVDEIQEITGFEKALRGLTAEGRWDVTCTGSNADLLSSEIATRLAGRFVETTIHPLCYPEFLQFHRLAPGLDSMLEYLRRGGLPALIHLPRDDSVVFDFLRNIYQSILFKDVVARHGLRNVGFLERLVEFLADNVGNLLSAKSIADFLKAQRMSLSPAVVINYLRFLAAAFFVNRVPRNEVRGRRLLEVGEKYYFEDLGLRHTVLPFAQAHIGQVMENAVFLHLRASGWQVRVGVLGRDRREIDFDCTRSDERMYLQVCYLLADDATRTREFGNLLAIPDNHRKMVISMDPVAGGSHLGIEHHHLLDFLQKMW